MVDVLFRSLFPHRERKIEMNFYSNSRSMRFRALNKQAAVKRNILNFKLSTVLHNSSPSMRSDGERRHGGNWMPNRKKENSCTLRHCLRCCVTILISLPLCRRIIFKSHKRWSFFMFVSRAFPYFWRSSALFSPPSTHTNNRRQRPFE
jgi:hypothetical protein